MLIRRFFAFVISLFLIFSPAYVYANTSVGGWSALDVITAGATNTINATKTAGGKVLTSAVTVAPSASKVGKFLIKGGGTAALLLAVPQLIGEGVDWVLDPANNTIKYKVPASPSDANYGDMMCRYYVNGGGTAAVSQVINECNSWASSNNFDGGCSYDSSSKTVAHATRGAISDQCYSPSGSTVTNPTHVDKSIPIDTVAAQVISNATAGHAPSQDAVKAVALEGFVAGEHDAALESAAVESDAGTDNPPDTDNPPVSEPVDLSPITSALNAIKALLAGILSSISSIADSVTGFFDWTQEEPPEELEPVPVPYGGLGDIGLDGVDRFEQRITFPKQCPQEVFSFQMFGRTFAKPIPYEQICNPLEQIAPWLLAFVMLGSAYFILENI